MKPCLPDALERTINPPNCFIRSKPFVPGTVRACKVLFDIPLYFFKLSLSATTSSHKAKSCKKQPRICEQPMERF
eukprot:3583723-Ditylum_brightwellii.AAC.1